MENMRPNIYKNLILEELKESPKTFNEIIEAISKKTKKKFERLKNPIFENLMILMNEKIIEKFYEKEKDKIFYKISNSYFTIKNQELLSYFLKDFENAFSNFEGFEPIPFIIFTNNKKIMFNGNENIAYNIANLIFQNFSNFEEEVQKNIAKIAASIYFKGVKNLPIKNDILDLKNKFELKLKEGKRIEKFQNLIDFSKFLLELIEEENLGNYLKKLFSHPQLKEIEVEEEQLLRHFNKLINFQDFIGKYFENVYFENGNEVWNIFWKNVFLKYEKELEDINYENLDEILKTKNQYLQKINELLEKSKCIVVYLWGINLEPFIQKSVIPLFESWLNALKEGYLDHRIWIYKEGIKNVEAAIKYINENKFPPSLPVDKIEPWNIQTIYLEYPKAKTISFWKDLLKTLKERKKALSKD